MKRLISFLFYVLIVSFPIWLIGFLVFVFYVLSFQQPHLNATQAIVAWTGGEYRIQTAFKLLEQNPDARLLISGMNKSVSPASFLSDIPQEQHGKIDLGYQATTTEGNAIETADWVYKNKITSVTLVTSFYHMPRSLLEFKHALPQTTVYPYAIWPKDFQESVKWIHTRSAFQLLIEYHKYVFVKARYIKEEILR